MKIKGSVLTVANITSIQAHPNFLQDQILTRCCYSQIFEMRHIFMAASQEGRSIESDATVEML
jgi:hypothetical protein